MARTTQENRTLINSFDINERMSTDKVKQSKTNLSILVYLKK